MKRKIIVVFCLFAALKTHAQDSLKTLNEVIVTATKTLIKQSQTGKVAEKLW
jgi:hypothetical protein